LAVIKNHSEVLKREIMEGDEAEAARTRVNKFYKKVRYTPRKTLDHIWKPLPRLRSPSPKDSFGMQQKKI
jgi:hypothetical protein